MFSCSKSFDIAASHQLNLPYDSPCNNLHGHNYKITIHCKGDTLNSIGMLEDFSVLKRVIKDRIDHKHLNDVMPYHPTAENLAKWLVEILNMDENLSSVYRADVYETDGNFASFDIG